MRVQGLRSVSVATLSALACGCSLFAPSDAELMGGGDAGPIVDASGDTRAARGGGDAREAGHDAARDAPHDAASDSFKDTDSNSCTSGAPPSKNGCITSESGVFVSTAGADKASHGTMTKPYASVSYALKHLGASTSVYVCAGVYTDAVTVSSAVNVYGGLTCTAGVWAYLGASAIPVVVGSSPAFVLDIDGVAGTVEIDDMKFEAASSVTPGTSSVAVWVDNSGAVTFERVTMIAGIGAPGSKGALGSNYSGSAPVGGSTSGPVGAPLVLNSCMDGTTSIGGAGGNAGMPGTSGLPGSRTPPLSSYMPPDDGQGGDAASMTSSCGIGDHGGSAPTSAAGNGATTWGTLTATGWTPTPGGQGGDGTAGQGGGGGGGGYGATEGGGGGGAGGCGGGGGGPGGGGGSSFALLSYESTVSLYASSLTAGTAGNGGSGGDGQAGQAGGAGGAGDCIGGTGGTGAGGGGAGGGAGGLSVGAGYVGHAPSADSMTTYLVGSAGAFGSGGSGGAGALSGPGGTAGIAGVSATLRAL